MSLTFFRLTAALFSAALATSCMTMSDQLDFVPAQGWILVKNGSISSIEAAVIAYDGLALEEIPGVFLVELHPQSNGTVAVLVPRGLPAYDLANLTGWLNAPPDQEDVHDAVTWITSPHDGIKYYLEPDAGNQLGDTLIGASNLGRSIRVYLPETGISEISERQTYREEPNVEISSDPAVIEITLDTATSFGNPRFVVDHPADHRWDHDWAENY